MRFGGIGANESAVMPAHSKAVFRNALQLIE